MNDPTVGDDDTTRALLWNEDDSDRVSTLAFGTNTGFGHIHMEGRRILSTTGTADFEEGSTG